MSHTAEHRSVMPPRYWSSPDEMARKLADSVRGMLRGETNNHYTVLLDVGTDCTEIRYPSSRPGLAVQITAQNQAGATFQRTNDLWGESEVGLVKICHDSTAVGTEKYGVVIVG